MSARQRMTPNNDNILEYNDNIASSYVQKTTKLMWSNNTRNTKLKGDQIEMLKILNRYGNIDSNIFPAKIMGGKRTRLHVT